MSLVTLWLNRNIASSYNVLESIRESLQPGENWRIVTTHPYPYSAVFRLSDAHEVEPAQLGDEEYVRYALDFIRRHKVNVFLPGTKLLAVMKARHEFEALGVTLMSAADADVLHTLDSKPRLYRAVPSGLTDIPDYRVANDLPGFDAAVEELSQRHPVICFKPCISVYGLGFRILNPDDGGARRMLNNSSRKISLRQARASFGAGDKFRPLILMPYLPGPERSIDCLAHEGRLVCCVVRRKTSADGYQKLEANPELTAAASRLTEHFRLDCLFNVQFRDSEDKPYLLEINTRMSGGLYGSCLSGVAFPYWAVRLALGTAKPEDVPHPQTGFRIAQVNRAVRL